MWNATHFSCCKVELKTGRPIWSRRDEAMMGPWWCRLRGHRLERDSDRIGPTEKKTICLTCGRRWDTSPPPTAGNRVAAADAACVLRTA